MRTRDDIEQLEDKILAPYAMKSKDSSGREYDEPDHATRTCYQRDRDRIIHSEAFRKLEYKTQVFTILEGDYYRTRLTHTIEVAQMGRTIGRNLRLNEDLIEAIALAHDLGHPPFGHAGEDALNMIMTKAGLGKFNHNERSFKIVTAFERRYPNFPGLNLTTEVRVGILKHQTVYDRAGRARRGLNEGPTLEAQVVDFADSLAYLNHDIDDGLTSGYITEQDLIGSALWQRALRNITAVVGHDDREMLKYQIVKELIDMQIKDLLSTTDAKIRAMSFRSVKDVKKNRKIVVGFSARMTKERDALQRLLNEKLYHHYRVVRMTEKAKRIIHDLFYVYLKEPTQLPYSVYRRGRRYSKKEKYEVICHYIASMTDRFALEEHKKVFHPYEKI
ncbi:MAG: deoxyguanosinetriphosphate triphosphohydrolase [Candidatus Omnitrophota bacterium]|nr:deoxyguanosinetriphosphate triphosphohydrolase [Candidatus Omnitrophota bacterium]MDZ4242327.1 deoxyguanosinetriphosphate triphosphohydrolase [Candidatus Omnitrophota bacterium]